MLNDIRNRYALSEEKRENQRKTPSSPKRVIDLVATSTICDGDVRVGLHNYHYHDY